MSDWIQSDKETIREDSDAVIRRLTAEIERLRAALQNLVSDILEYERINNLSPNPGKQDCWQSVTEARRALDGELG